MTATLHVRLPKLRPLQRDLYRAMRRWNVWVCHRRFGKTLLCLCVLIKKAFDNPLPAPRYAYIAPLYRQAKAIAWDYCKRFAAQIPGAQTNEAELRLDLPGNRRIQLLGADNPDSIRGIYLDGAVLDEYAQMRPRAWTQVIRPALSDRAGWAIKVGTPFGRNHFYYDYQEALDAMQDGDQDYHAALYRASETGVLSDAELASARATMRDRRGTTAGDADYLQEYECFPPGTLIATPHGQVPIEQLRTGDVVISHSGRARKVQGVMAKLYVGALTVIATYGNRKPLRCTPNHPVRYFDPQTKQHSWKEAGEVRRGDWLVMPRMAVQRSEVLPRISCELASLLGWYIAEGSLLGNAVQFSLGTPDEVTQVGALLDRIGASWSTSKAPTAHMVQVNDARLADFFLSYCGSTASEKRLPHALIQGQEKLVLDALIAGDGSEDINKGAVRRSYVTASYGLALDVQLLAHSLGYRAGISQSQRAGESSIQGRKVQIRDAYTVQMYNHDAAPNGKMLSTRHSLLVRVRDVSEQPYEGMVHNLMVAVDNSYVAEGRAVHNCEWDAPIPGAVYGDELAWLKEQGRIGDYPYDPAIPVQTWWDFGWSDQTAIWFAQERSNGLALIDYAEGSHLALTKWVRVVREKPYVYDHSVFNLTRGPYERHYAPHDLEQTEYGYGKTRYTIALENTTHEDGVTVPGLRFTAVPIGPLEDGIEASRKVLRRVWINVVPHGPSMPGCQQGLDALRSYQYKWDDTKQTYGKQPEHSWASHGADALRTGAVGLMATPPPLKPEMPGGSFAQARANIKRANLGLPVRSFRVPG